MYRFFFMAKSPSSFRLILPETSPPYRINFWVADQLAEGRTVADMARATGHTRDAIYWHLKQTYQKLHISRQADLVRLVLSIAELG